MFTKLIVLVLSMVFGFFMMVKNRELVRLFGRITWAERKLGPGGSETMWKLGGVGAIIFGLLTFTDGWGFLTGFLRTLFGAAA